MSKNLFFCFIFLFFSFSLIFSDDSNVIKIAVLDISSRTKIEGVDKEFLTERLQIELSKYRRLRIVERLEIKKIIEEQKLQLSGIAEKDASKIGGISGAQKIVTGSLTEVDDRYFLIIKVIDTTTSELDFVDQISGDSASELSDKIRTISRNIADVLLKSDFEEKGKNELKTEEISPKEKTNEAQEKESLKKETSKGRRWFPFGIAFAGKLQLPPSDFTIQGIAISFVGYYESVKGIYVGFMNRADEMMGYQHGFMNFSSENLRGIQIGFMNFANEVIGVQVGFLNRAYKLKGVQIGFLNMISTGALPFMFGINMSF